jgi:hypothetical protein
MVPRFPVKWTQRRKQLIHPLVDIDVTITEEAAAVHFVLDFVRNRDTYVS